MSRFLLSSILCVLLLCSHHAHRVQSARIKNTASKYAAAVKDAEGQQGVRNRRAAIMQRNQESTGVDENTAYQNDQRTNIQHIIAEQPSRVELLETMPFQQVSPTYTDDNGKQHTRKDIYLLDGAMPPVWPHRLGTLKFITDRDMGLTPDDKDGLLETNDAGTPLSNGSPCGQARQPACPVVELKGDAPAVDIPFNTQLEDIEFKKTQGSHWFNCSSCAPPGKDRYVETKCCTYVDNFDTALFQRQHKKGTGITLGSGTGLKEVDFAVHWEVGTMNFGESIPVVAPQAFIGFGVDGSDSDQGGSVILDLGMAFYACDASHTDPSRPNIQDCTFRGMLNFETEANHAKGNANGLYAKPWPEFPGSVPREKRVRRCSDPKHMCDGIPNQYSGLVFQEKVKGGMVAEYSGELIGGGGDGDDSWMYLDLDGLKSLGVTHALLTGHEYNQVALSKLTGAFYRVAAGKVINKQGHMQTILYQDLDEAKEPPTPRHPNGEKTGSNAMLLGVFSLRSDEDWSFGPMPEAAKGNHWQFTVLNTPIVGRTLSRTTTEIANVLNKQILEVPVSEQAELNALIGTALDLNLNEGVAEMTGDVNVAYQRLPGGAPGAATRNFHFLPEKSTSKVSLEKATGAEAVCAGGETMGVAVSGKVWYSKMEEDGTTTSFNQMSIDVREPFGRFTAQIQVTCGDNIVGTVERDQRRSLPPLVFTAAWSNFESDYMLPVGDTGIVLHFRVKVTSAEW